MAKKLKPHEMRSRNVRVAKGMEQSQYAKRMILPERHLFVTEGAKTEPLYLESMIDCIVQKVGEGARKQLVVYGAGDNTLNLLKRATAIMDSAGTSSDESKGFQHVWVIYDRDSFPADDFDNAVNRCDALTKRFRKQNRMFHAIWSNECFEVWLLFHFMFLSAGVPRSQYGDMLSKRLGKPYDKLSPPAFSELKPRLENAVANAKRQMDSFSTNVPPSQRNPCSNFYRLIETFDDYI